MRSCIPAEWPGRLRIVSLSFELSDDIVYNGLIPGEESQGGLVFQGVCEIELLEAGMHGLAPES